MGCDGGSIPKRDELVKVKKKEERANPIELERTRWFFCAMSKERLRTPVVCCQLGFLYNKDVVIKHLLDKNIPETFGHIKTLKDVITLNFTANKDYKPLGEKDSSGVFDFAAESPFQCPVTGLYVGSNHKFSTIKSCGCVLSEKAFRECPSEVCLVCTKPFKEEDVLPLNPDENELKELKDKLKEKLTKQREARKKKHSEENSQTKRKSTESSLDNNKEKTIDAKKTKIDNNGKTQTVY